MRAIVFGSTGFIGSHVVEQLLHAGHEVTAVARHTSNISWLKQTGAQVIQLHMEDRTELASVIQGHDVVYNCTADAKLNSTIRLDAPVEIQLTKWLTETAAAQGVARFVQLSTIVVYDFRSIEPIDERYDTQPMYPIQQLALAREEIVQEAGLRNGMKTVILRPASTIGVRDQSSFFARKFVAHARDQYPIVGGGSTKVSLVDTRDIGRAMEWLGTYGEVGQDNGVYVLKGFDTTWMQLKEAIDAATGKRASLLHIPAELTEEQRKAYPMSPFAWDTLTTNRIWDDSQIRQQGFQTLYSMEESVTDAVRDLMTRQQYRAY
ncbi:NAD(P)-dependent oxidoreductase [Paenibacillus sp. NAIST15-1]|uniref:NAD-dependent epimerase/dehydratase family protein n=1 Tax=Paenibacillus sp. NAIST15-1 TaxID=1605994 RepID=UPI000868EDB1|nr:NAD(P)-dependent oxidoreductase [Paenibacillus sp. NAIST15-1]GAV13915.1 NAD-dependent epimerase/dehydratase [Paenibacillus sp. NAIST15-1]